MAPHGDAELHVEPIESVNVSTPPGASQDAVTLDDAVLKEMATTVDNLGDITKDAALANEFEKKMSFWQALKLYPKACAFSFVISLSLIMEGYDTSLLGNFFGYPSFQMKFGNPVGDGTYQLSASWQSGLQNGVQVGEIIGLWIAGTLAERYGYRKTLLGALVMMIGVIFIMFFAQNIYMLFVGEILCGLPWGAFQTLTTTYAAEIGPPVLRPMLTTWNNACWTLGQLLSAGVMRGLLSRTDDWGWRIPYATQWIWPLPIIIGVLLAPESPWWLIRHDQPARAERVLTSLLPSLTPTQIRSQIALITHTNAHEHATASGTTYWTCLATPVARRRTEITCLVWVLQVTCGVWFGSGVMYFLEQAGFSATHAFDFGLGHNAVGFVGVLAAWWVMLRVGRRTLYLYGLAVMGAILVLVGVLGIPAPSEGLGYASGALLYVFTFVYAITVGPVAYCLVTEMPSSRLRIKTVALARNAYNVASIAANFLNNPILNPTAWNLRGKGGFVWCGFAGLSWLWAYYRLPETKGRSSGELDVLFERGISARMFSKVTVDEFRSEKFVVDTDTDGLIREK